MPENLRDTFEFLRDLRANNEKQWFDQNRRRYDSAREHFEAFVTEVIAGMGRVEDLGTVTAKDCMYRINRDVRFSHDKSPYKTTMSAVIGKGGRKTIGRSYYLQIAPDGESLVAGGLYDPSTGQLDKMRRAIAEDSTEFRAILQKRAFKRSFGSLEGDSLKTAPQGYTKDHPDIDLLRLKQYLAAHTIPDEEVLSADLTAQVVDLCKTLKPFLTYVQMILDT